MIPLEKATLGVVHNLKRGRIYSSELFVRYDSERKRVSFSKSDTSGQRLKEKTLEEMFRDGGIRLSEFYDLGRGTAKATHIANFWKMLGNRVIVEIAKKTPSPGFKNHLYRLIGVNIPQPGEVIVAPNVFMDYLYPQLVKIEPGVFIGEEAGISCHYFDTKKFAIGTVTVGEDSVIGGKATILPGVNIGVGVEVGIGAVVNRCLTDGEKVEPNEFATYRTNS